jgi:DNA (cytosine-5)-methyltransferase 1
VTQGLRGMGEPDLHVVGYELDDDAVDTHQAADHYTVQTDLRHFAWAPMQELDLVHASPPCQPFSAGGTHGGMEDPKNCMPAALRAIKELQPRVATIENVKGLASKKHRAYLGWILKELHAYGYDDVEFKVINAADFGVPQTRQRLWIVARNDGAVRWPHPTHARVPGMLNEKPWVSMADALGWDDGDLVGFPRRDDGRGVVEINGELYRERDLVPASMPAHTIGSKGRSWLRFLNTGMNWPKGGTRKDAQTRGVDQPAPTVSTRSGRQWHWHHCDEIERVTIQELAVLQGFPADYPWQGSLTSQGFQVGNAVPPAMAAAVIGANL